jgi:hypothetical protein
MWLYWFWKKDIENGHYIKSPEYYRDQCFQKFIFDLNMPYLRVVQTAYTNISIYDRVYCEEMFVDFVYPDGTLFLDCVEDFISFQKAFMEMLSKLRETNLFTYPVLTYCLVYRENQFQDEEFAKWASRHNMRWADSNFLISPDTTSAASCCFDGKQKCLTRNSKNVNHMTFEELYNSPYEIKDDLKIFHNGSWVGGKIIKAQKRQMYKITTSNKKELYVTDNHTFPTLQGDKTVDTLTLDDYLMFSCRRLDTFPEKDKGLTYEQGFLIGMYLGDGSCDVCEHTNKTPTIFLSLNESKYEKSKNIVIKAINGIDENADFKLNKPYHNVYPTSIRSWSVYNFIKEYVSGNYCYEKELNLDVLLQSYEFRKGILDGYYITDGGNSNRIYTTSKKLCYQVEALITSLGINSVIDCTDRTDELVVIRGQKFKRNYPLYCIRWYNFVNRRATKDIYKVVNNSEYFKITSIEKYDSDNDSVYCFEMTNQKEPYFTLPNGVISHNCRLLSKITDLKDKKPSKLTGIVNSIGGSSLDIGSVVVTTLNLAGLAYQSKTIDDFWSLLESKTRLIIETNDVVRNIIKRNIEKGLLPNYAFDLMKLEKQMNTIGINGVWESAKHFGFTEQDEIGFWDYTDEGINFSIEILDKINTIKDSYDFDYSINVEQTPMEQGAIRLARKNQILYGSEEYITGNQWIALKDKATIQARTKIAGILDNKCGGGCISHIQIQSPFTNEEQAWKMLNYIAQQGVIYFAFNLKINIDENKHSFTTNVCPTCGEKPSDTYQRCVGYLVPTKSWSDGRKKELEERDWMNLNDVIL